MAFREALPDCCLLDLGYSSIPYTWKTTCGGGIQERRDRLCVTVAWKNLFSAAKVMHMKSCKFDHILILLEVIPAKDRRNHRFFRFEEMWTHHEECDEIIHEAWVTEVVGLSMFQVCEKIKATRMALNTWQHKTFKTQQAKIELVQDKITAIDSQPYSTPSIAERTNLSHQLNSFLLAEESYWKQRSMVLWMKVGDRNTRFFHQRENFRKQNNGIELLIDQFGDWKTNNSEVRKVVIDYFSTIFQSQVHSLNQDEEVIDALYCKVTPQMNMVLDRDFNVDEIKDALFQMHLTKSPGLDGMPPLFFQRYWSIVEGCDKCDNFKPFIGSNVDKNQLHKCGLNSEAKESPEYDQFMQCYLQDLSKGLGK